MVDKITLGTPPIMPVAPVGDRPARLQYPATHAERVKPKATRARDTWEAIGERKAPAGAGVYTLADIYGKKDGSSPTR